MHIFFSCLFLDSTHILSSCSSDHVSNKQAEAQKKWDEETKEETDTARAEIMKEKNAAFEAEWKVKWDAVLAARPAEVKPERVLDKKLAMYISYLSQPIQVWKPQVAISPFLTNACVRR